MSNGCQICQPRAKFTRTSHFKVSYSGHCWPEASFHPSSISRLSHFPPITHILRCGGILSVLNYLSSYLFLAVITLDEPGNRSLWRAGNTLQEGAVVLRRIHHPVIGHIKLFWLKERWSERFLVWGHCKSINLNSSSGVDCLYWKQIHWNINIMSILRWSQKLVSLA